MNQDITSGAQSPNDSSGLHRDRVWKGDPEAKNHEISWNGYPIPLGVRVTGIPAKYSAGRMVENWENVDYTNEERTMASRRRKKNGQS
jgi:hypothetical protein